MMVKLLIQTLKIAPVMLGALLVAGGSVSAQIDVEQSDSADTLEQIENYSDGLAEPESMGQVTNVEQLRDVSPGDWAYEALSSLVERYGCIEGYPDQTYRGNRALTRYEFAAGLNSCLNAIERLIASSGGVSAEDLERLQRLAQEFEAELATLGARVDNLEGRVAFLEDNQFSTTTKLTGEVLFNVGSAFGDQEASGGFDPTVERPGEETEDSEDSEVDTGDADTDIDSIVTLSDRVRLNFDASFTGEDLLRAQLQARNIQDFDTGTGMTTLNYSGDNDNDIELSDLSYVFPVGERLEFMVALNDITFDDYVDALSPYFIGSANGALSLFGGYNILLYPSSDAGLITNLQLSDNLSLYAGYLANNTNDPSIENGLFNGDYSALAQVNFGLGEAFDIALTYTRTYQPEGEVSLTEGLGSLLGDDPYGGAAGVSSNRVGVTTSLQLGPRINLGAWFAYVNAQAESSFREDDNADIITGAATLAFLDLGKEGSVLGIAAGVPPKLIGNEGGPEDDDTSILVEARYQFPVNDNITFTPGAYVVFNPNHNEDNDNVYVGVVKTVFSF